jgi:hypothetical protein
MNDPFERSAFGNGAASALRTDKAIWTASPAGPRASRAVSDQREELFDTRRSRVERKRLRLRAQAWDPPEPKYRITGSLLVGRQ